MLKSALALLLVLLGTLAQAQNLEIVLLDNQGKPLSDAVLWIEPGPAQSQPATAVMDQQKRQFTPYVLPVQVGTTVSFPNADPINHHVYSFSPAKRFELRLHLGCNIHDWMLGFILVLDTPWFAQTDSQGKTRLDFDAAAGQTLHIWHPRIADPQEAMSRAVPRDGTLTWQLTGALKRDPRPKEPKARPMAKDDYAS